MYSDCDADMADGALSLEATAAAAATLNTLLAFGFEESRARAAVAAIGDKADVQLAMNYLLDHREEDRGGESQP